MPKAVVGGQKNSRFDYFKLHRKTSRLIIVLVLVIIAGVGGWLYYQHTHPKLGKNQVRIDGQVYTNALPSQNQIDTSVKTPSASQVNQQIQVAQEQVAKNPTWQGYVSLGSLYSEINNTKQAVAEYQLAKKYVPRDDNYQGNIDNINTQISLVQEK